MSLIMPGTGISSDVGFTPLIGLPFAFPTPFPGGGSPVELPPVFPGSPDFPTPTGPGIGEIAQDVLCGLFGIGCPPGAPQSPGIPSPGVPQFPPLFPLTQFPSEGGNLICDLFGVGCPPGVPGMPEAPGGTPMPTMPFNGQCVTPTATGAPRAPTVNMFACPNTRGGFDWWGKLGRPLWFTRDNQVVRRGKKLARRLR